MDRHDAIFGTGGNHSQYFLGSQVGGDKGKAGYPERDTAVAIEEVVARLNSSFDDESYSYNKNKIDENDQVVGEMKFHNNRWLGLLHLK
jgi:hypothetical protein